MVPGKVAEDGDLGCVDAGEDVGEGGVMSPGVAARVQSSAALTQDVAGGLQTLAQHATLQVCQGGEGVDCGVEEELEGALLEVVQEYDEYEYDVHI